MDISHLFKHGSIGEHPWGLAAYEPTKKLCYVQIPKNASTTCNKLAISRNWWHINYLDFAHDVERYVVVLRDPVERLISGVNMFLTNGTRNSGFIKKTILRPEEFYTEDCHFEKQHKFIRHIDHSKIDFFYFNQSVISEINNHYDLGFENILHNNKSNPLITNINKHAVRSIYIDDVALIQSVKFVNSVAR